MSVSYVFYGSPVLNNLLSGYIEALGKTIYIVESSRYALKYAISDLILFHFAHVLARNREVGLLPKS